MRYEEFTIEGRNAVLEAFRCKKTVDKLFVLDGCQDGPVRTIVREAKKHDTIVNYVTKERLDQMSETGKHQGVIASVSYTHLDVYKRQLVRCIAPGHVNFIQSGPLAGALDLIDHPFFSFT